MSQSYSQIYIHYVFITKFRQRFLRESIQPELSDYIGGYTKNLNCFMQCIGGMEDHLHLLIGLKPSITVSEFAQKVKANSSRFIHEKGWTYGKFEWQPGFGAFSLSQSNLENARKYIKNQKENHQHKTLLDEYEDLLRNYKIGYDKRYLFDSDSE